MASNPLYSTNDSPTNQTTPSKAVNRQGVYVPRTHNTFDMSYFNFKTQRFAQYETFFAMEGVPGDHIPFSTSHNVRSLPFASPFLSSLKLNKDFFLVPNQAIQPHTWEYIFKNPSQGDDVPEDAYNVFDLYNRTSHVSIFTPIWDSIRNKIASEEIDGNFIWSMLILELFFSSGSLLYNLGFKLNPIITADAIRLSFDEFFDRVFHYLSFEVQISVDDRTYYFQNDDPELEGYVTTSTLLDLLRFFGSSASVDIIESSVPTDVFIISNLPTESSKASTFNCDRICAYQLACSQYYVNPQVDYLYNAQLYRDNFLASTIGLESEDTPVYFFTMNGIRVMYDSFSYHSYKRIVNAITEGNWNVLPVQVFDVLSLLFGYKEQLKFGDYFTDSRTRPLAVGNTDINVNVDNSVSVVDVSQKIVLQRFLNNVIKLGNNFGDYLRGIFGTTPSPDYHFPKFIIHQDFDISGFETAQTVPTDSSVQGTSTSQLMSGEDTFVFEIDIDMPCVIIGISYFSVPLVYSQTKDRHFQHSDRFDFFNPMMQYTGDQPVYLAEKTDFVDPNSDILGYQSRYGEYKQRVSVASGGFISKLPAWSFVIDDLFNDYRDLSLSLVQSPVAIRHQPYQFDRFFKAISGLSLGHAFHFIVVYNNKCMCNRPMEINPNIL